MLLQLKTGNSANFVVKSLIAETHLFSKQTCLYYLQAEFP